jgi:hypothetical protein
MNLKQKTKRFSGMNRGPRGVLLMGKTVGKKTGASVPLMLGKAVAGHLAADHPEDDDVGQAGPPHDASSLRP